MWCVCVYVVCVCVCGVCVCGVVCVVCVCVCVCVCVYAHRLTSGHGICVCNPAHLPLPGPHVGGWDVHSGANKPFLGKLDCKATGNLLQLIHLAPNKKGMGTLHTSTHTTQLTSTQTDHAAAQLRCHCLLYVLYVYTYVVLERWILTCHTLSEFT